MISVLDRLATEFRDVQRSAESVAQPFACLDMTLVAEALTNNTQNQTILLCDQSVSVQ